MAYGNNPNVKPILSNFLYSNLAFIREDWFRSLYHLFYSLFQTMRIRTVCQLIKFHFTLRHTLNQAFNQSIRFQNRRFKLIAASPADVIAMAR